MKKQIKFDLPNQVRMGGITYSVEWVESLSERCATTYGVFSQSESKILLSMADIDSQEFAELVFVHELLHAMLAQTAIPYMCDNRVHDDFEECLVRSLAPVLLSVMKELKVLKP